MTKKVHVKYSDLATAVDRVDEPSNLTRFRIYPSEMEGEGAPTPGEHWKYSFQCLDVKDGDLLVLRFPPGVEPPTHEIRKLAGNLRVRERDVQILVLPSNVDIQQIGKTQAAMLLRHIVDCKRVKKGTDHNGIEKQEDVKGTIY